MNEFVQKTVTVIGTALSGQAAARLALRLGALVRISEKRDITQVDDAFRTWMAENSIVGEFGGHTREFIEQSDYVVVSPGVAAGTDVRRWPAEKGIPVIGEVELASRICRAPVIAVTGSNGKTTVVTLITRILERAGKTVKLCGNVGDAFSDYALDLPAQGYAVVEISSFQLETIARFKPHVALFLNFSQNHLDRHRDLEEYFAAKVRIFANQDGGDFAVLNAQDARIAGLAGGLKAKSVFFNTPESVRRYATDNPDELAAAAAADLIGVGEKVIRDVFKTFSGVEHRLERVAVIDGVQYVNDSKSTTTEATRWALQRINAPIILLCGGRDKNMDYSVLTGLVEKKVKMVIAFGEARDKLQRAFSGVTAVRECLTLPEALSLARDGALNGDCILLSPMCASFDQFKNFEERGKVFKDCVHRLVRT